MHLSPRQIVLGRKETIMSKSKDLKATVNTAASTLFGATTAAYNIAKTSMCIWGLASIACGLVVYATGNAEKSAKDETAEK
nr:MAG TPA: hypothetical protein [Caudoviricetes sp.]